MLSNESWLFTVYVKYLNELKLLWDERIDEIYSIHQKLEIRAV